MDRSDILTLVKAENTQNAFGVWEQTLTERDVFCAVRSVTQTEFFEGGRNGLNPAFQFTLFFGDYEGETVVKYKGSTYAVYRTYIGLNDTIELYAERKGGTNGKAQ